MEIPSFDSIIISEEGADLKKIEIYFYFLELPHISLIKSNESQKFSEEEKTLKLFSSCDLRTPRLRNCKKKKI